MSALGDLLDVTPVGFLLDFAPNVCSHNDETPKTGLDLTLYVGVFTKDGGAEVS
jgi:hypothetical protein